ncbi:TetR/AcrR family transcriptional regulator [Sphaerisporangium rhizosphaerae]|uniref:TetR/AcrR family transcriptional regulator n=1 Tax=Sphaerisporangium rhizosphaerae TaxID=2269375 RepID=A0ABW2NY75_9ACTN
MSRRRGERLEQAILDATWELLAEMGYAKLTMEAVAARAGTSRPVIHRRWPTRAQLALAALDHAAPADTEPPDTGGLRTDLLAMMEHVARRHGSVHGEVLAGMAVETARDPEAAHALRARLASTAQGGQVATIVRRAVERGEIPAVRLPSRVARLPLDLMRNEVVVYGRPPGEDVITEIVDSIVIPAILHAPASEGLQAG